MFKNIQAFCLVFIISLHLAGPAFAQSKYPSKPIRLVVGYPPGGTADQLARVLAEGVGKSFGQNVIV